MRQIGIRAFSASYIFILHNTIYTWLLALSVLVYVFGGACIIISYVAQARGSFRRCVKCSRMMRPQARRISVSSFRASMTRLLRKSAGGASGRWRSTSTGLARASTSSQASTSKTSAAARTLEPVERGDRSFLFSCPLLMLMITSVLHVLVHSTLTRYLN